MTLTIAPLTATVTITGNVTKGKEEEEGDREVVIRGIIMTLTM